MSPQRTDGARDDAEQPDGRAAPVSPLTVPLLLLGLLVGFFSGYFFLWWGLLVVGVIAVAALSAVITGRSRDAAGALLLGTVGGFVAVVALAFFRGVL